MKKRKINSVSRIKWRVYILSVSFILLTSVNLVVNATEMAKTITLQFNDLTLKEAITEIEKATGYSFFYDENNVNLSQRVSLRADNNHVEEALSDMLKSTDIDFKMSNNQIALLRKTSAGNRLIAMSGPVNPRVQQQIQAISGVVVDEYNEPVIGANVVEKGTTNGTITDIDGQFNLNVAPGAMLEVTYIGYVTQTVAVTGTAVHIILKEDAQALDEVIVTGFGLSQKKATLSGAITQVGSEEISRSVASTASGALVGKIAGLNTRQTDGRPGATTSLQIRNMGTPLFVIDGVQSDEAQFNNIDFNDIENITVLKDASAAIYGVRAANGVVVVSTKRGRQNTKNTVALNTYYGWQKLSDFPKPANIETYLTNLIQSQTVKGDPYKYSKEDLEKWKKGTEKGYMPFDWYDYIWETAPQYYLNANVSGGSDKINYYFSVGHMNQDAVIVNYGGFERTNAQMNVDAQITPRFKMGASMNGRIEKRVNPGVPGGDDYWLPRFATYRNLPTHRPFANDNPEYPAFPGNAETNFAMLNYERSGKWTEDYRVIQLNANAEYELLDGLTAKALMGYFYSNKYLNNHEYTYELYGYDEVTEEYKEVFSNDNPWRERETVYIEELTSNIQLSYAKRFNKHNVSAIVGFEAIKRDNPRNWVHAVPTANSLGNILHYTTIDTYDDDGLRRTTRMGWMGRFNYDYAGKYLFEFSGRYDASSKFPPGSRWGFFPSGSLGWRISEEAFWENSKLPEVVNDFKIRASYGMVGDDDLGKLYYVTRIDNNHNKDTDVYKDYDYLGGYDYYKDGAVLDGKYVVGAQNRSLPVTTLSWIKAQILDIGFDVSFLDQRLTGQFDFFRRKRTGLPQRRYDVSIPVEVGFELPIENLNSDVTMGYDGAVRWSDRIQEVHYSVGGNITYARKYDWFDYDDRRSSGWDQYKNSRTHRYANLNWGLIADGQFQSWEEIANHPIDNDRKGNTTLRPGDIKYKDLNGDGVINSLDERPIGYEEKATPILNYGINLAAGWRGFDIALDFTGASGNTWYQESEARNPFHDGGNNPQYYMENTWHLSDIWDANSELIKGKYPMLLEGNAGHSNYWSSTFWKKNVRYIKLRNLEVGYTIPKHIVQKVMIQDLRVYIAGTNLFTLSNLTGVDPEQDNNAGLGYPTMRIINIGLNLKF